MQNNPEFASNINNLCVKISMKMYELYNKKHELLYVKVYKIYKFSTKCINKLYNYIFNIKQTKSKIEILNKSMPFYNMFYRLEL